MVKHNNVVPNQHFKKDWDRNVKVHLEQAARKQRRSLARKERSKKLGTRPLNRLRPIAQCQTQRYNIRSKLGRGFTEMELKAAGINVLQAPTIGISVDKRRKNRSQEALDRNVARLKEYMSKLIVFPRNAKHPKKGDSTKEAIAAAKKQTLVKGAVMPLKKVDPNADLQFVAVTPEMQNYSASKDFKMQRAYAYIQAKRAAPSRGNEEEDEVPAAKKATGDDE